mmetsp:Transcript_68054/g.221590  ORF Transcript_68054/g.221590 Transcript_68054/m.221590 type:complete len:234 (+) Transcript_68054:249-950(+)
MSCKATTSNASAWGTAASPKAPNAAAAARRIGAEASRRLPARRAALCAAASPDGTARDAEAAAPPSALKVVAADRGVTEDCRDAVRRGGVDSRIQAPCGANLRMGSCGSGPPSTAAPPPTPLVFVAEAQRPRGAECGVKECKLTPEVEAKQFEVHVEVDGCGGGRCCCGSGCCCHRPLVLETCAAEGTDARASSGATSTTGAHVAAPRRGRAEGPQGSDGKPGAKGAPTPVMP